MKLLNRDEVKVEDTWDLKRLFKSNEDYELALKAYLQKLNKFTTNFKGEIKDANILNKALIEYANLQEEISAISTYASLAASVDGRNEEVNLRLGTLRNKLSAVSDKLTFLNDEIYDLDEEIIKEAISLNKDHYAYLNNVLEFMPHKLSNQTEKALVALEPVLSSPYQNYGRFKFADMKFDSFKVNDTEYPLSFSKFENEYDSILNTKVRHLAYETFYNTLKQYENGFASNYQTELLKQKALAKLRGFNSTEEYLLFNQKVSLDIYNRQIDVITDKLRAPMRKYAKLIKKAHNLDEMTWMDLKLPLDPEYSKEVSIEEAKQINLDALKSFGPEYEELVSKAINDRWIDFPQNLGKSTGGFCSSPYRKGSFILLNWNNQIDESFVLAHEIGHAGHFHFAGMNQSLFNTRPSMYFIEAPSTINELVMAEHLLETNPTDLRFKRYILSAQISRTYYHNFVTHLLEASFQREVYRLIDNDEPITAKVLRGVKTTVLRDFWGDDVKVSEDDGLTWMRQPHYFMGLYPYTYSAGLTISTNVMQKFKNNELKHSDWLEVLKAGGTLKPLDLAKMVNVDLSTSKPLEETIEYIANIIDEIEDITNKMNL